MQASWRDGESAMEDRLAHNHVLQYSREEAVEHYLQQALRRKQYYDKKTRLETFLKGSLVLRYDNRFDNIKGQKMVNRWRDPLLCMKFTTMEVINSRTSMARYMSYE